VWMCYRTVVQTENALDDRSVSFRNLNGPGVTAIGPIRVFIPVQFDVECLFHIGRGAGQGDGPAADLIAARQHLEVVFAGKLPDLVNVGGVGAIHSGEVTVAHGLASMLVQSDGLTVFQDHRDLDELMWRSRSDGARSSHWGVLGPLQRYSLRFCHCVTPLEL